MDNKLAGVLILTAFASGYGLCLYQAPLELPAVNVISAQSSSSSSEESFAEVEFPDANVNITNTASTSQSAASSTAQSRSTSEATSQQEPSPTQTASATPTTNAAPTQLSDEEIDQLIPKPFNTSFKKAHPDLKTKYKDFVDPNKRPDDWDIRMQGLLRDFIMSRPMATDIIIDALACNANMCEVRLLENKKYLLLGLFGELMQQPWMTNQVNGTVDFNPDNSNACYILLMRKKG